MVFIGLFDRKYTNLLLYFDVVAAIEVASHMKINQASQISVAMQHMDEVRRHAGDQRKNPILLNSALNSRLCHGIATQGRVKIVALVMDLRPRRRVNGKRSVKSQRNSTDDACQRDDAPLALLVVGLMRLVCLGLRVWDLRQR